MMELEKLRQQEQEVGGEDEEDDDLFGSENEPVVVDEKGNEVESN
jgi:hypothetical protein